jgi:hypothetical protein
MFVELTWEDTLEFAMRMEMKCAIKENIKNSRIVSAKSSLNFDHLRKIMTKLMVVFDF